MYPSWYIFKGLLQPILYFKYNLKKKNISLNLYIFVYDYYYIILCTTRDIPTSSYFLIWVFVLKTKIKMEAAPLTPWRLYIYNMQSHVHPQFYSNCEKMKRKFLSRNACWHVLDIEYRYFTTSSVSLWKFEILIHFFHKFKPLLAGSLISGKIRTERIINQNPG